MLFKKVSYGESKKSSKRMPDQKIFLDAEVKWMIGENS